MASGFVRHIPIAFEAKATYLSSENVLQITTIKSNTLSVVPDNRVLFVVDVNPINSTLTHLTSLLQSRTVEPGSTNFKPGRNLGSMFPVEYKAPTVMDKFS